MCVLVRIVVFVQVFQELDMGYHTIDQLRCGVMWGAIVLEHTARLGIENDGSTRDHA